MNPRLMMTVSLLAGLSACADSVTDDEFATEDTAEVSDAKADIIGGTYTYYSVTPDLLRRCPAPRCGGYFVARVNRTTTKCADGTYANSCYVASTDWDKLGFSAATVDHIQEHIGHHAMLLRGTIGNKNYGGTIGNLGEFRPTEAWLGQGPNEPTGPFARVVETGVRCIQAPCPIFREKKLNASAEMPIAELGWDQADLEDAQVTDSINELFERDIIIAGTRYDVSGPGGIGKARTVTQVYTRAHE
jgi:hypothetical protein